MKKTVLLSAAAMIIFTGCGEQRTSVPAKKSAPAKKITTNAATAYPAAVVKSGKRADTMACTNNLKQLGIALIAFEMDNNRFPKTAGVAGLQELLSQQSIPASMLCCPSRRPGTLTENDAAFLYVGNLASAGAANLPLAIEKPGRHGNNTAVLFADGHVKNLTVPGEYTSVTQVIALTVPANARAKYLETVKQIEK